MIHSLRADFLQAALLEDKKTKVVLNSFGNGVWIQEQENLTRKTAEEAGKEFSTIPVCVSWLPEEKQEPFENPVLVDMKKAPEVLLRLLQSTDAHPQFITDYEVPAVVPQNET